MANAVTAFLDRHLARGAGDRPAVSGPGQVFTYAEIAGLAARCGHALRALGVEPEQRVALALPDGPLWAAAFFGALRIGAVAVPVNPRLDADGLLAILRDSRAKVLVAGDEAIRTAGPRLGELGRLRPVAAGASPAGMPRLEELMARSPASLEPEAVGDDDMALWLYTSGTTGVPKAAVHLHRDLLACRHYGEDVLQITPRDRILATSRLFFAYALGNALLIPFFAGASTYLTPDGPDPREVAAAVGRIQATALFSVPTFYARFLRADLPPDAFRPLRLAVSAGERLPADLHRAFIERFGLEILDGMGATETIFMVLANRPGRSRPGSSGTPVPGSEVRLVDADGREVEAGGEGVLHVKTPSASPGYWCRRDESARAFAGGWFRTGDVYTRDADGFYHHRGREDDRFKVAGQWVAPGEVEAALRCHPEVADAGVVGVEEAGGLVKACAFVVSRAGRREGLEAELRALAERTLPPHQRPRRIVIVAELPRTATGKLQRYRLRALAGREGG